MWSLGKEKCENWKGKRKVSSWQLAATCHPDRQLAATCHPENFGRQEAAFCWILLSSVSLTEAWGCPRRTLLQSPKSPVLAELLEMSENDKFICELGLHLWCRDSPYEMQKVHFSELISQQDIWGTVFVVWKRKSENFIQTKYHDTTLRGCGENDPQSSISSQKNGENWGATSRQPERAGTQHSLRAKLSAQAFTQRKIACPSSLWLLRCCFLKFAISEVKRGWTKKNMLSVLQPIELLYHRQQH